MVWDLLSLRSAIIYYSYRTDRHQIFSIGRHGCSDIRFADVAVENSLSMQVRASWHWAFHAFSSFVNVFTRPHVRVRYRRKSAHKVVYKRKLYSPMSEAEWLAVDNVWGLSLRDRWRLYNSWASLFCHERSVVMRNLSAQYNHCAARLAELNAEEDYQVGRSFVLQTGRPGYPFQYPKPE